jgi:hypothetical protein
MKYSLRSLMIVVTLICVVIGGRIEYLRRMAAYHERESNTAVELIPQIHHSSRAEQYRAAMFRPWTVIDGDRGRMRGLEH